MTITDITPEQLAVLIGFCRREAHRGEYMTPEVQAFVEAVSGPCFAEADEFGYCAPLNSDGSEA